MSRKILIVDDNEINRRILGRILGADYETVEAKNGAEALSAVERDFKTLSAVLLDINMPEIDGYEVLRRVKANPLFARIPVIIVTGNDDDDSRIKALSLGAGDFITKPYSPALIRHCLKNNIALCETAQKIDTYQTDALTGLLNREFFFEKAEELIKAYAPGYYILTCFDIDDFKLFNDEFGAAEGDALLARIGASLKGAFIAEKGLCGRITGDNFAGLYPNRPEVIERMSLDRLLPPDIPVKLTLSEGRYVITDASLPAISMYDRAFIAKSSVKGRYDTHTAYFDDAMLNAIVVERQLLDEMDTALSQRQFEVWYQPQYNHATGGLIGAEALVRWRNPERGLIPPGVFIPVFERSGSIYELDKYVWEEVCRALSGRLSGGGQPLPVSVNISRFDMLRDDIDSVLSGIVERYGIPANLLHLEITESAFSSSTERLTEAVIRLVDRGFTVELDDFGCGYSSLNTLKDVPAQTLKMDMKFLESSADPERSGSILESVVRMAKWLGMTVIAEGVETAAQADFLKSIGCFFVQGYLYARPMPLAEYEALLSRAGAVQQESRIAPLERPVGRFWDHDSLDTLIFNSYIGGASVFEMREGEAEIIRANDKYARIIGGDTFTAQSVFGRKWSDNMDSGSVAAVREAARRAVKTGEDVTVEAMYTGLRAPGERTWLRFTFRRIARSDDRFLVYSRNEDVTQQHLAEEKERAAEELRNAASARLRVILNSIDVGVTASILEDGRLFFLLSNDRYYELCGYTKDEYISEAITPAALILPEFLDASEKAIRDVIDTKGRSQVEIKIRRKDGSECWLLVQLSIARFSDVSQDILLCVYADIDDNKRLGQQLQATTDRLRFINDNLPAAFTSYTLSDEGYKLTYFNNVFCELLGYTREELEAPGCRGVEDVVLEKDRSILEGQLRRLLEEGTPVGCVYRIRLRDGSCKWLSHNSAISERTGDMVKISSILLDVTERMEATEKLRMNEEELRLALRHSGTVLCRFTIANRTLTMPRATAGKRGLPNVIPNMPYAMTDGGYVAPDDAETYIGFYESIVSGAKTGEATYKFRTPAGWRWITARSSTVFDDDGAPSFAVVSYYDVTERLEKEAVYKKWQQSLEDMPPGSYTLFRCNLSKNTSYDSVEGTLLPMVGLPDALTFNELTQMFSEQYVHEGDRRAYRALLNSDTLIANYYRGVRSDTLDFRETPPGGGEFWLRLKVELVEYPNSSDIAAYLMYENIDKSKKAELHTIQLAHNDPLTGVLNRSAFCAGLERVLAGGKPRSQHALLMLDLDGFKQVNDILGHAVGDRALIDSASALRGVLRRDDLLGRLGGDEFLVLLSDVPDDAAVVAKCRLICAILRKTLSLEVQLSASIGVAMWPRDGDDYDTLYKKADAAMYSVKRGGRDGFAFYRDGIEDEPETELQAAGGAAKNRRMLIVTGGGEGFGALSEIFKADYRIEKAVGGSAALISIRHYGAALSVVLMEQSMYGMDGFAVLEKLRMNADLRTIPVVLIGEDEGGDARLTALRAGAADYCAKPLDGDELRVRVEAAVYMVENARRIARSSFAELQSSETKRYRTALERSGIAVIEHDWVSGSFIYDPSISAMLAGTYDGRKLWHILLSDMVADTVTVQQMQSLVHDIAGDRGRSEGSMTVRLKSASNAPRWFILRIYKLTNEFGLTDKLILTLKEAGEI